MIDFSKPLQISSGISGTLKARLVSQCGIPAAPIVVAAQHPDGKEFLYQFREDGTVSDLGYLRLENAPEPRVRRLQIFAGKSDTECHDYISLSDEGGRYDQNYWQQIGTLQVTEIGGKFTLELV